MEIKALLYGITSFLLPHLPKLTSLKKEDVVAEAGTAHDAQAFKWAKKIWDKIKNAPKTRLSFKEALSDLLESPADVDALAAFRYQLKKYVDTDPAIGESLKELWLEMSSQGVGVDLSSSLSAAKWIDVLNQNDDVLKRLEMVRLLRTGVAPETVAAQFHTDLNYLFRVHSAFSLNGVYGILSGSNIRHWHDMLNKEDPILRRLEMIRLLRSGSPVETISKEYHAVKEYIYRLNNRFSSNGVVAIMDENDFQKYRALYPPYIKVCSFNLHGVHDEDPTRLKRIANELCVYDPDLCAYQEVIKGAGIEETSLQIADMMSGITGMYYRTQYGYCHMYMNKYPEGIAVSGRYNLKNPQIIDLNKDLVEGLHPLMDRYAAAAQFEIYGHKVIFASVHLDHSENPRIRYAQVEKLVKVLESTYGTDYHASIIAGDFNDTEDSVTIEYLTDIGYKDAYRHCHRTGGNTFDSTNPFTRIDYIMVKGKVKIHSAELILKDPKLSDHIGVYAVIE
ncbi:MAG: endonuclease/exonuclease/phosphatase family protein [Nitrospirae bacterium]|nr:endonuclease/exonuclease/phosphatase family protein [Nitrospirota bacterium]MBF0536501.1 endonuclease/exonuclease/phosphatase family protein [Nitrospirota bacterium]MBF0618389.1 endonuclease/exonuclease/phosphatase family protein [Nitrospirota bacterium]